MTRDFTESAVFDLDTMKNQASVIAIAIITLALPSCSKKSVDTTTAQHETSGRQVVTNEGFVTVTKRTVKPTSETADTPMTQQEASGRQVVTNDGGFLTVTKRTVKPTSATNAVSK